jgi:GT2 family glycosyltransferase
MPVPIVSIIIPTYNGRHLLDQTLAHNLRVLDSPTIEWIVSDDGSHDDTATWLSEHFPSVKLVTSSQNQGFAVTAHRGALAATSAILFFLNNDMKISDLDLSRLVDALASPDTFAIVPTIIRPSKDNAFESITWGYFKGGWLTPESYLPESVDIAQSRPILWACGGAMAVRRDRYLELGGFDPLFSPFYFEDLDLSYRAWQRGWASWYMPLGTILHDHQATIGRLFSSAQVAKIHRRNHYLFMWRNLTSTRLLVSHFATMTLKIVTLQRADIGAIFSALRYIGIVLRYRWGRPPSRLSDLAILEASRTGRIF